MRAALRLARKGAGHVSPNPMVGALIVKSGRVIARGYHQRFGDAHAEVNALRKAGSLARGADMYVTLEPCCHHGKTPPCADALVASGIRRVFVGMQDPNPAVSGRGIRRLRRRGVAVTVGMLAEECRCLNEAFIKHVTRKEPFVILKAALTLDGRMATRTGDSKWITCEQSRALVHRVRSEVDAVMVGAGTVVADDPLLTVRLHKGGKNPCRVVLDSRLRIPRNSRMLQAGLAGGTIIVTSPERAASAKARALLRRGAQVWAGPVTERGIDLRRLLQRMGRRGFASILIEGGSELHASALACGAVDRVMLFFAPKILGGKSAVGMVGGRGPDKVAEAVPVMKMQVRRIGTDLLVEGYVEQCSRA